MSATQVRIHPLLQCCLCIVPALKRAEGRALRFAALAFFLFSSLSLRGQLVANFTANPVSGCVPAAISFQDLSTGNPVSWFWSFGNGNTSVLQNPAAIYWTAGTYTVTLTVTNAAGVSSTFTRPLYISVYASPQPIIQLVSGGGSCPPQTVVFHDNTVAGSAPVIQWLWDFGDGTTSTLQHPTHVYTSSGNFGVTLIVWDQNGCSGSVTVPNLVYVAPGPTAGFTSPQPVSCSPPMQVNFTNTSFGGVGPLSYFWNFGDGGTSTATNPMHIYTSSGTFSPMLVVVASNGCRDTLIQSAYVSINQVNAQFSSDTVACTYQPVQFNDQSTGGIVTWLWDFGDGSPQSTLPNPIHSYSTPGYYTVSLFLAGGGLCADTLIQTNYLHILPPPVADFAADTTGGCSVPFTVNFSDSSSGATSWLWNFGDGSFSSQQNPTHVYGNTGTYNVTLTVWGPSGCVDVIQMPAYITVYEPVVSFVSPDPWGCAPHTVHFVSTVTSTLPIVSWLWDFGDGNISGFSNPSHIYTSTGYFNVSLTVTNSAGCSVTYSIPNYVAIGNPVNAAFTVSNDTICPNVQIQITNQSSPNANFWQYCPPGPLIPGPGGPPNIVRSWSFPGNYPLALVACNYGCCDTSAVTNIHVMSPGALFTPSAVQFCSYPATVNFNNLSVGATSWSWNFGDGNSSTAFSPTHTYTTPGVYFPVLTVNNSTNGCTDTYSGTVNVNNLNANFNASTVSGCGPLSVSFTNTSTGSAQSQWNFGDGTTSTAGSPVHVYALPGTYTVTLIVWDGATCWDTIVRPNYISVSGPVADFSLTPGGGCMPLTVSFTNLSWNLLSPVYTWDFGDGTTSNAVNPVHQYTTSGYFSPQLTVTDLSGCTSVLMLDSVVNVTDPQASFYADFDTTCVGAPVQFTNTSSGAFGSVHWDFGDGSTSAAVHPSHVYNSLGAYTVMLVITDLYGCQDTAVLPNYIHIVQVNAAFTVSGDSASCPPLLVQFTDGSSSNISYWEWSFGDGASSNVQNPVHIYTYPDTLVISLIVAIPSGCRDTATYQNTIQIGGPSGTYTITPTSGCVPLQVNFNANVANAVSYIWDFGDGAVVTTASNTTSHWYTYANVFHPVLIASDTAGCMVVIPPPDSVIADSTPVIFFHPSLTFSCGPASIQFTDSSITHQPIASWLWNFGDGTFSTAQHPLHVYSNPGVYTVTLTVTTQYGCTATLAQNNLITISSPPIASFTFQPSAVCTGSPIAFSGAATGPNPIVSWSWFFGDGTTSSQQNPVHTYSSQGQFLMSLLVTDSQGCVDLVTQNITVFTPIQASFTVSGYTVCTSAPVVFTALSPGFTSWVWDFDDGTSGSGNPVSHLYAVGNYLPTLTATDIHGCTDVVTLAVPVQVDTFHAQFSFSNPAGCIPHLMSFADQTVSDSTIVSWLWNFGDGFTSALENPSHYYNTAGVYTVTLTVTNSAGCVDVITLPQLVTAWGLPSASFNPVPGSGCQPLQVSFNDLSSGPAPLTSWTWDFGNGNSASGNTNIQQLYTQPGAFIVNLTVTDVHGCTDQVQVPVTVHPKPVALFSASDSVGCLPFATTFSSATPGMSSYLWDFGDGNSGSGASVSHTYQDAGYFDVTLIVNSSFGCADTLALHHLLFVDSLVPQFDLAPPIGCIPLPVNFTDESWSDTTITGWNWTFGDGGNSLAQHPGHTYVTPGIYPVTLVVNSAAGCSDSVTYDSVLVFDTQPPPAADLIMATVVNETTDSLSWHVYTGLDFAFYHVMREEPPGSGSWITIATMAQAGDTTFVDAAGINTLNSAHCYRVIVEDVCGYQSVPALAETHCTMNLTAAPALNQVVLNWTGYAGFNPVQSYDIYRVADWNSAGGVLIGSVPGALTSFVDTAVVCYRQYHYRIRAQDGGSAAFAFSDTSDARPIWIPNPHPAEMIQATVENDAAVRINWSPTAVPMTQLSFVDRSTDGLNWTPYAQVAAPAFTWLDQTAEVDQQSYYYRVSILDSCGDLSPLSNHGRSIVLDAETRGGSPVMHWNEYTEWQQGVDHYEIEIREEATGNWLQVDEVPGNVLQYEDKTTNLIQREYCYRIRAIERNGNQSFSLSNEDCVNPFPSLYAPNAFTPNDDGVNDFCLFVGRFIESYEIEMFDRWGQLIYVGNDVSQGWNGKYHGKDSPEGAYVYVIHAMGTDGTPLFLKGTVTLIR